MSDQRRWLDWVFILLAFGLLNVLGRLYHRWVLGVVAGVAVLAVREVMRRTTAARPPVRKKVGAEHAVVVYIDGTGLSAEDYDRYDLETIETELLGIIDANGVGEYDGNEVGERGATLFMYGPDGERLFATVESALRAYPLTAHARVVIRAGPPGAPQREVRL
jgi:hypothetical protein